MEFFWVMGYSATGKRTLIESLSARESNLRELFAIPADSSIVARGKEFGWNDDSPNTPSDFASHLLSISADVILIKFQFGQTWETLTRVVELAHHQGHLFRLVILRPPPKDHAQWYWAKHGTNESLWDRGDRVLELLGRDGTGMDAAARHLQSIWPQLFRKVLEVQETAYGLGITCQLEIRDPVNNYRGQLKTHHVSHQTVIEEFEKQYSQTTIASAPWTRKVIETTNDCLGQWHYCELPESVWLHKIILLYHKHPPCNEPQIPPCGATPHEIATQLVQSPEQYESMNPNCFEKISSFREIDFRPIFLASGLSQPLRDFDVAFRNLHVGPSNLLILDGLHRSVARAVDSIVGTSSSPAIEAYLAGAIPERLLEDD